MEGLGRLDQARGSHGEDSRACRHHGREGLERILLDGTGAGAMAGGAGESRVSATHAGHRVRHRAVSLEQAERGAGHDRLGQCEAGQGEEGKGAGTQGPGHCDIVTPERTEGQAASPAWRWVTRFGLLPPGDAAAARSRSAPPPLPAV